MLVWECWSSLTGDPLKGLKNWNRGFGVYCSINPNKEPPQDSIGKYLDPYSKPLSLKEQKPKWNLYRIPETEPWKEFLKEPLKESLRN